MANEISLALSLRVSNGNADESFSATGLRFDQSTQGSAGGIIEIGTSAETIALGDVTTAGFAAFRNLSTATAGTAYIAIGSYDGTNIQELAALRRGQPAVLPLVSDVTLAAKSYGEALPLRYVIFSE